MKSGKRPEKKKQGKTCDKNNWSETHLEKECKIAIDTDDVRVIHADGCLFKLNGRRQEGKLLFYYRLPCFPSATRKHQKMLLRATIEVRMNVKTLSAIADSINKHFSAIQKQTSLDKFAEPTHADSHIMFG